MPALLLAAWMTLIPRVVFAQDCLQWADRTSPPGARASHAMAYDNFRGTTVLFGGVYYPEVSMGDTWQWDGSRWELRSLVGPSPRFGHAMAYGVRGVTVLFGGRTGVFDFGETWEWNGSTWTLRSNTGPSPRVWHAMAYDSDRGVTAMFGGSSFAIGSLSLKGDTWEWNGSNWTQRSSIGPSPRSGHAMVYDSLRGVTVLFGGWSGSYLGDTWEWDGASWTLRSSAGPSPRSAHAMVYDSFRGVTVLFGGHDGSYKGDTWEWNGTNWTPRGSTGPSSRARHAMAYDGFRGVTVLFGGDAGSYPSDDYQGDTWELSKTPFDSDCDGDLDLGDASLFQECFSPGVPPAVACERFDRLGDEGVDLEDFAGLVDEMTGPMPPLGTPP